MEKEKIILGIAIIALLVCIVILMSPVQLIAPYSNVSATIGECILYGSYCY